MKTISQAVAMEWDSKRRTVICSEKDVPLVCDTVRIAGKTPHVKWFKNSVHISIT
jgi:hypothetical protein